MTTNSTIQVVRIDKGKNYNSTTNKENNSKLLLMSVAFSKIIKNS